MKWIFYILFSLLTFSLSSQTVIEMTAPGDANIILLEVDDSSKADIIIYKTESSKESCEWDCMWKFKKWGFSNFGIYITKDPNDPLMKDEDFEVEYVFHGKVYFTTDKNLRGYRKGFALEGIMRVDNKKK
jgi:hypothetical protein